jgi:hypothetical protein
MRTTTTLLVAALGVLAALAAGCSVPSAPSGPARYVITRSWSTGYNEDAFVYADGRVVMHHGVNVERITLPVGQVQELDAAAASPVAPGSNADDPISGITARTSATVRPAGLRPGSLAELLNRILDAHTLHP